MADDPAAPAETAAAADLTDKQVDQYFEAQGEIELAEAPAEEAQPEKASDAPEKPADKPPPKYVPLEALHEEREKRKDLQRQVAAIREDFQRMLQQRREPEKPPIPDPQQDAFGHLDQRLRPLEQAVQQTEAQRQQQAQEQAVIAAYANQARQYAAANPEAQSAYTAWVSGRIAELRAAGYDDVAAARLQQQEEFAIAVRSMQEGENPMGRIHAMARARGWKPEALKAPAMDAGAKVAQIAKGVAASKAPAGGTAPEPDSLEALAEMDEAEFVKNWDRIINR